MTGGQVLYLLLVVGSFAVFMLTLAYYAARYSPRPRTLPAQHPEAVVHEEHVTAH